MIIPYEVDVPMDRRPVVNWLLIAATVGIFVLQLAMARVEGTLVPDLEAMGILLCSRDSPIGWFTSIFLHADLLHIIGNMIFLYVFGNAVCSKIGNVLYLPFYLALGLAASFTHMTFSDVPALGASGAINGIVGAYLVFFPLNTITCAYFIYLRPGTFSVSGYWMILYWLAFDILGVVLGGGGVAYWAHLGGFAAGVAGAVVLLKLKLVEMERDELSLLQVVGIDKKPEQPRFAHDPGNYYAAEMARVDRDVDRDRAEREAMAAEVMEARRKMISETSEPLPVAAGLAGLGVGMDTAPDAGSGTDTAIVQPIEELIRFACPCGKKIKVPVKFAGKKGKCPKCGAVVRIPAA